MPWQSIIFFFRSEGSTNKLIKFAMDAWIIFGIAIFMRCANRTVRHSMEHPTLTHKSWSNRHGS